MPDIEELLRINAEQAKQLAILQQQVEYLKKQLYGRKSEKSVPHPELFKEEKMPGKEEAAAEEEKNAAAENLQKDQDKKAKRKRPIRAQRLPATLPIVLEECIPAEVKSAPEQWRRIGEDTRDQLEKEPGYFYLKRLIYPKFVRRDQPFQAPITAPAKPKMIDGGFWGSSLLSEILTNKYLYHLPFYRQERLYANRFGIELSRKTMCDATQKVSGMVGILVRRMKERMLAKGYVQADETPITYLDPDHPKGSQKGYFWVYRAVNGEVIFDWRTSREHKHVALWLGEAYEGILQTDGYEAYVAYVKGQLLKGKAVKRASCLAHIRRKFKDALDQRPQTVGWFLKIIGKLYGIEETLRRYEANAEARARMRQKHSRPLIDLLQKAITHLLTNCPDILPKSMLGKALRYAHGQWSGMKVYLERGEVEIDNNGVYAASGISQIMPPPDLCRAHKLEANIPFGSHSIPYSHAA